MSQAPASMVPGMVFLGRYRLVRLLGEGGMGTVFEAEDRELRRQCALKVLQAKYLKDARACERFTREAAFAASLDHEHVVRVFDRGVTPEGTPYYTMELLRGWSLAAAAEIAHRMPWSRVRHIGIQLCRVIALAHARGIVHRDLKPENCFLVELGGDRDFLKLLDFGLARQDSALGDPKLTNTTEVLGTMLYMSPQQARGEPVDHRADVYAIGVTLYLLLGGYHPFERANQLQVIQAIQTDEPQPLSQLCRDVPQAVEAVVARAMHKRLESRFQSAEELLRALEAIPADAKGAADASAVYVPPTRVHSPTALANTAMAGTEETAAVASPAILAPPTTASPVPVVVPTPESRPVSVSRRPPRRVYFVALVGLSVAGLAVWWFASRAASRGSEPVATVEPVTAPVVTPAPSPEPEASPQSPTVAVPEVPTQAGPIGPGPGGTPAAKTEPSPKKPPSQKPESLTRAKAEAKIRDWKRDLSGPRRPAACSGSRYTKDLSYRARVEGETLKLDRVSSSLDTTACAEAIEKSFSTRFRGTRVRDALSVEVNFQFEAAAPK